MTAASVKAALQKLAAGESLGETEMSRVLDAMSSGEATPAQMGAFLMALRVRGETVAEITGAARLMRERMITVSVPEGTVDIVGTGGDGHNTYNVSTCAAFVAAGAGLKIAKHGNRSVSSLSGASDVLSALGVRIDVPVEVVARAVREAGVGFLWAPLHHPAFKAWAPIRADLGVRTMFNLLGPICNPARVKRQVVGVFAERWVEPVAEVLRNLGTEWAWVVHGRDGLDELSTTGPTLVAELASGQVRTFEVDPRDVRPSGRRRSPISRVVTHAPTPTRSGPCSPARRVLTVISSCSIRVRPCLSAASQPILPTASCVRRPPSTAGRRRRRSTISSPLPKADPHACRAS